MPCPDNLETQQSQATRDLHWLERLAKWMGPENTLAQTKARFRTNCLSVLLLDRFIVLKNSDQVTLQELIDEVRVFRNSLKTARRYQKAVRTG